MKLVLTSKKDLQAELNRATAGGSMLSIDSGGDCFIVNDSDLEKFIAGKLRQGFQCAIFNPVSLQRPKTIIETIEWNKL